MFILLTLGDIFFLLIQIKKLSITVHPLFFSLFKIFK